MAGTPTQQLDISSAIANIRSAEELLDSIISNTGDAALAADITAAYQVLDNVMTLLIQAQMAADDTAFTDATSALKGQAATLKAQEAQIHKLVSRVALAAQVAGYVAQAVAFIAAI